MRADPRILSVVTVGGILLLTMAVQPGRAQQGSPAVAMKSVRDGVYTAAQVDRGATTFEEGCSACHVPEQFADPLFMDAWTGPAADLFGFIRATMPEDSPGRLRPREYADILAYLFSLNGLPAGETEMKADLEALEQIRIEAAQEPTADGQVPGGARPD